MQPEYIDAFLNYSIDTGKILHHDANADNGALDEDTSISIRKRVTNARTLSVPPSLASHGFQLTRHRTSLSYNDFVAADSKPDTANPIRTVYYNEVAALVCGITGAAHCVVLHHMIRTADPRRAADSSARGKVQGPAAGVHCDYTARTALGFYDSTCPPEIKASKSVRFMVVNVWRNISDTSPILNDHLAQLDATTVVAPDDFVAFDFTPRGAAPGAEPGHTYRLDPGHHEQHKWYYYPAQTKQEALLFTQYDSDSRKYARYTFHTSMKDPTAPKDYFRESIEMRTICFFPDYDVDTVPKGFLVGGADAVVRSGLMKLNVAVSHIDTHWDVAGKTHVRALFWGPGGREKTARWFVVEHIVPKLGLRGDKPSQEQIEQIIAKALEPNSLFCSTIAQALPQPDAHERVRLAVDALTNAVRPDLVAKHWDAGGKAWAAGAVKRGRLDEIAEGLVKHSVQKGENGLGGATEQQQREVLVALKAQSSQFKANCVAAFR